MKPFISSVDYLSKYVHPVSSGTTDPTSEDRNDCGLRAYCNVTGKSFKDAQIIFAKQGRKYKRGTPVLALNRIMKNAGFKVEVMGKGTWVVKWMEMYAGLKSSGPAKTIKTLLNDPKYQKGKHMLCVNGHALAVVDGKVLDTFSSSASARVYVVYSSSEM